MQIKDEQPSLGVENRKSGSNGEISQDTSGRKISKEVDDEMKALKQRSTLV